MQVPLSDPIDIAGFHQEATRLLAQQVAPDTVEWSAALAIDADARQLLEVANAKIRNRAARAIIPQSFVRMSELVVLHRDPLRFDLLYRSLWRLVYEPDLRHDPGDVDLARLRQMAQSVRRDLQKMKTRMVFHTLVLHGKPVEVCWYEPSHFIGEAVGGWLSRRDPGIPWLMLTPDRSMRWDCLRLLAGAPIAVDMQPRLLSPLQWTQVLEAQSWL